MSALDKLPRFFVFLLLLVAAPAAFGQGFVVVTGDDADDSVHCQGTRCGGLYPNLFNQGLARSQSGGVGILAIGVNSSSALTAFNSWNSTANGGPGAPVTHARTVSQISTVDFNQYALVYTASVSIHTSGGMNSSQLAALNARQPDIAEFVNDNGGSLIALTQADVVNGWGFLPVPLETLDQSFENATPTPELQALSPNTTQANLSHCCFHNVFTGPPGFSGLRVLAVRSDSGFPVMLGGVGTILTAEVCDDGIDNDDDGLVDHDDPDCQICGDGVLDPDEQCDDGNTQDGDGCSADCDLEIETLVAICQPAAVPTEPGICAADVAVDAGSHDPRGLPIASFDQQPPPPYQPGTAQVELTVTNANGFATCDSQVTVTDPESPVAFCNAPAALDGTVGTALFNSTAEDNCDPLSGVTVTISDAVCRDDDPDDDGVPDEIDECPDSDTQDTVIFADCDTGVFNVLFATGCTMLDEIYVCGEEARNHGEFVSCVAHLTNEWRDAGLITGQEKGEIQRCAAQAPIPIPRGPSSLAGGHLKDAVACAVEVAGAEVSFPDVPGIGRLSWTVTATDAGGNSVTESCVVAVQNPSTTFFNLPPAADAGADQNALVGDTVVLDGSGSQDLDSAGITYQWSLVAAPAGSTAALVDGASVAPSLTVDVEGDYVVALTVSDGELSSAPDEVVVRVRDLRPVADAGPDFVQVLGDSVTFDGSGSFDPEGGSLTYGWTLARRAPGSAAELDDPASPTPSLTPDLRGAYVAQLIVDDGLRSSLIDAAVVVVENVPPVADAGPDQDISTFDLVQLDGSGSSDFEGDPLTYAWTMTSRPAGSAAMLSSGTVVDPTFTADVAGAYVIELVVSDGFDASLPDTVVVTTVNTPPVADAGPNQVRFLGDVVQLDGSGSSDVDGDDLTYAWTLTTRPVDSAAQLDDPASPTPTFVADVRGPYAARLVVDDGQRLSQPDTVTVAVINRAPVVVAASPVNAAVGYPVVLDGGASFDPDGDPITYAWTFLARPAGSSAALSRQDSPRPFFTPDAAGDYSVQLVLFDGDLVTAETVSVVAVAANSPPNADAGRDLTVGIGDLVTLSGAASDAEGDVLTFAWSFAAVPAGSALTDADLLDADTLSPGFVPDVAGTYELELTVDDGASASVDGVLVTAVPAPVPPRADAGPDVAARSGDVILLDGTGSVDPDDAPAALAYAWTLVSAPPASILTSADLATPAAPTSGFVPDVAGLYVVRLRIDDGAFSDADNAVVHIDDGAPGITFTEPVDGTTFFAGNLPDFEVIYFDQETGLDLSSFELLVGGDDVTDEAAVNAGMATFTPAALDPGSYTAAASISDRAGNSGSATVSFTVSDAIFRAIADCAPTEGIVPLTVRFRSRGEFEDGSIVRYRWDFEGDGRFDTSDPVARDFTRTFTTGGIREAVLEVTNNFGQVTTDTCTLRVSGTPPLVTTDAVPSNGAAPLTVDFVCDATDPDGVVALYEWDFEGDGVFDYSSPSSGAVSHTYAAEGTFPAVCRVTDGDGLVTRPPAFNTTVRVGPAGTPTVTAVADPTAGDAPLAVSFDGTATDDGAIVLWEWDFDGDGSYDFSSPSSPVASHTYTAGGIFGAALRGTDDDGNTSVDEIQIDVGVAVSLAIPVDTFEPSLGETVSIETTLSGDAPMRLLLRDRAGQTVRTLFDGPRPAGIYADVWDGLDGAGLPLPHGPYFAVVEYDVGDDTRVLDLTNTTGGSRYNPPRLGFPSVFRPLQDDLLEITFVIPSEASEVTAFIGLFRVDTRLVTLLEREPFGVGTHTIYWDGTGLTGSIAVPPPGDSFLFGIFGFTQPDNAVMLEAAPTLSDVSVEPNFFNPSTPGFLTPDDPVAVVTYSLDKQADVELTATNLTTGVVVRTLVEPAVAPGAGLTLAWDGRTDDGLFADKSDYRLTLRAIDAAGNVSIHRFALVRLFH